PRLAFAFDPRDSRKVYFFAGFSGPIDAPRVNFSFSSSDAGATWVRRRLVPELTSVAIDPRSTDTLVATTAQSLLRSDDVGRHWHPSAPAFPRPPPVAFDRRGALSGGTGRTGVWSSRDGGTTFQPMGRGLEPGRIASLLPDPAQPGRLFASIPQRGV